MTDSDRFLGPPESGALRSRRQWRWTALGCALVIGLNVAWQSQQLARSRQASAAARELSAASAAATGSERPAQSSSPLAAPGATTAAELNDEVLAAARSLQGSILAGWALMAGALLLLLWRIGRIEARHSASMRRVLASEETYRSMVVSLDHGVMIFDAKGRVQGANPAAEKLLGRTLAELRSSDLTTLRVLDAEGRALRPDELPVAIALKAGLAQREVPIGLVRDGGNTVWFYVSAEPLRHADSAKTRAVVVSLTDFTERRRVETALHDSEATHRALMDALADGVFVAQDHRFVHANTALPAMLGYGPGEFVDLPFEQVVAPDVLPLWTERFEQRVGTGVEPVRSYEVRFLSRDGSAQVELELVATRATYRGRAAVIGLVRQIAERKRAAAELELYRNHLEELVEARTRQLRDAMAARAESETFAQIITDNQPTLLAYIDPELRLLFANRAYLAWFGRSRDDMIGQRIPDVLGTEVLNGVGEALARVFAGEAFELAHDMVGADGEIGHFWTQRLPDLRDGMVRGYFFIATNLTEVRRSEQKLKELNLALKQADAFTRLIADNIPARIAYWDRAMRCRFVNKQYCEWYCVGPDRLIGRTIAEVVGAERFALNEPRVRAALRGEPQRFEREETNREGNAVTTEVYYVPDERGGEVRGYVVLALDVTQQRLDQQKLEGLNADLVLARDRAEAAAVAKSAFLANMSHEIRTPMNAIIGLTHLLRRDAPAPQAAERLAHVAEAAHHLLEIINSVLDLSKIESGKLMLEHEEFNLGTLLKRAGALVAEQARTRGLELRIDTAGLPQRVRGDAVRLSQALVNLLANAVKFTERGTVSLSGSVIHDEGSGMLIRFEVSDTGIGIAEERIEQLFTAFEQADVTTTRRFGGSGLGLSITRHLARLMGGDAGARSRPGGGSTFWFTARIQQGLPRRTDGRAGALLGRRTWLVGEPGDTGLPLAAALDAFGLSVDLATASARDTLLRLNGTAAGGARHELMIVAAGVPNDDVLEIARALSEADDAELPALVVLRDGNEPGLRDALRDMGVQGLVLAPLTSESLGDRLVSALADRLPPTQPASLDLLSEQAITAEHRGRRVLLVEDNPVNQEVATTLLEMAGLDVELAQNGREAVDMASARPYDLILMDMQMPVLDGLGACRELRARAATASVPIIAMTANAYADDRQACLDAGMNDHLSKPVDPPVLYGMLARWLPRSPRQPARPDAER